jgi:hypothetical protein
MSDYHSLANLVGRYPECAIFRRFAALNAKRLLYMQAELSHLEHKLTAVSQYDRRNSTLGTSWNAMNNAPAADGSNMQSLTALEVSTKLDKYCEQ